MAASVQDVPIATPGGKDTSPNGLSQDISNLYQSLVQTQQIARQHRAALLGYATIENPAIVTQLGLTAAGAYSQAQLQAVADKLDVLIVAVNQLRLVMEFIKTSTTDTVVEP